MLPRQEILNRLPAWRPSLPLVHIGSLRPGDKGIRGDSYEGGGLSVSECPHAWEEIARLGGEPLISLSKLDATYVDLHALEKAARQDVVTWAVESGLAKMSNLWRSYFWDEDTCEWTWFTHASRDDAVTESLSAADEEMDGPEDEAAALARAMAHWRKLGARSTKQLVLGEKALLLTEAGSARACGYPMTEEAWDIAAMFWAEDVLRPADPNVVGVWWRERYSPETLSAPRGAIFPDALSEMQAERPRNVPDDGDLLRRMPRTVKREMDLAVPAGLPTP